MDQNKKQTEQVEDELLDTISQDQPAQEATEETKPKKGKHYFKRFIAWLKGLSPKQKALLGLGIIILAFGIFRVITILQKSEPAAPAPKKAVKAPEPAKPVEILSPLTGLNVTEDQQKRPVTGVMIENSPEARPQSGLTEAGVVFEAIAEGGITRFLAVFQETEPKHIGPVRSARPYYVDWIQGFDASLSHAGGSADALAKIRRDGIKDIDHSRNGSTYQRVSGRYSPHNLYTSMAKLDQVSSSKGWTSSKFTSFPRKKEAASKVPTASTVNFGISSFLYNPQFVYDIGSNSYKRSQAGKPHTDEKSGNQINPKVVIAMIMGHRVYNGVNTAYDNIGSGKCFVFQDGTVTTGTWKKDSSKTQVSFTDDSGKEIALNPGQTWLSAVGKATAVTYTP